MICPVHNNNIYHFTSNLCTPNGGEDVIGTIGHHDYSEKRRQQVSLYVTHAEHTLQLISPIVAAVRPSLDGGVASFCVNQTG